MAAGIAQARGVRPSEQLLEGRRRLGPFTRQDAEALVRGGILHEDASTELLNGVIVLKDRSSAGCPLGPFTRRDAEAMVRMGILAEDATTELLDGAIVLKDRSSPNEDPMTIGVDHRVSVEKLSKLRSVIDNAERHVESQQPLVCMDNYVPEPDFMILRGTLADYTDLATVADAHCVIEVADSSYERDAGVKLASYAQAGIRQYIIVNLRNRTAEVHANPDTASGTYPPPLIIPAAGTLALDIGEDRPFAVPMSDVLP